MPAFYFRGSTKVRAFETRGSPSAWMVNFCTRRLITASIKQTGLIPHPFVSLRKSLLSTIFFPVLSSHGLIVPFVIPFFSNVSNAHAKKPNPSLAGYSPRSPERFSFRVVDNFSENKCLVPQVLYVYVPPGKTCVEALSYGFRLAPLKQRHSPKVLKYRRVCRVESGRLSSS